MIVTLTMNPAIDRTVTLEAVELGATNRLQDVRVDASGKGVNVSRALKQQGVASLAMGLLAGSDGKFIADTLEQLEIETRFTWCEQGNTRVNTKVYERANGRTTELNEAGPVVNEADLRAFWQDLEEILPESKLLICSGSLPQGVAPKFYYQLISRCKELGVKVFFDSSGPALLEGIKAKPYFIKPNQDEIELLLKRKVANPLEIKDALSDLEKLGIPIIVISLGEEGAIFYSKDQPLFWGRAEAEQVQSTAGCGDALVASFAASLLAGRSWEEAVRWSIAAATATVELPGTNFPTIEHIERLLPKVQIEDIAN